MIRWKEWKKTKTRYKNLIKLGTDRAKAWEWANSRKAYWRISFLKAPSCTEPLVTNIGITKGLNVYNCDIKLCVGLKRNRRKRNRLYDGPRSGVSHSTYSLGLKDTLKE